MSPILTKTIVNERMWVFSPLLQETGHALWLGKDLKLKENPFGQQISLSTITQKRWILEPQWVYLWGSGSEKNLKKLES